MVKQSKHAINIDRVDISSLLSNITLQVGRYLITLMPFVSLANPWEITSVSGNSVRCIDLLYIFAWFIFGLHFLLSGKVNCNVLRLLSIIILYICISLYGVIAVSNYQVNWAALIRFVQTISWGVLALTFLGDFAIFKIFSRNIIFSGSILALYSIYLRLTNPNLHRIAGFFSAAGGEGLIGQASFNEIGALSALAALISFSYLFYNKKELSGSDFFLVATGLILNVISLLLVQSRSGILALAVGLITFLLPELKKLLIYGRMRRILIRFIAIFCLTILGIIIGSTLFAGINRLMLTFSPGSNEFVSAVTRLSLWRRGLEIWLLDIPHFLLGYGFRSTARFLMAESAHNFFLNIGLWSGLIGLTFIIVVLIWPLTQVARSKRENFSKQIATLSFTVAFVVSMTGNVLVDPFYGGLTFILLYGSLATSSLIKVGEK